MGKSGRWREAINKVMIETEGGAKGFRKRLRQAQSTQGEMATPDIFENVHGKLDKYLRDIIDDAMYASPEFNNIQKKQFMNDRLKSYLQRGDTEKANQFLDFVESGNF